MQHALTKQLPKVNHPLIGNNMIPPVGLHELCAFFNPEDRFTVH